MGRLTEYFGGKGYTTSKNRNGDVEIIGADELLAKMASMMTKDPVMERAVRKLIKIALQKARNRVSKDIHGNLTNDPRKAYRAVKHSVFKAVFGGSVSILAKKRRGNPTSYVKPRKLQPGQRGGNRVRASEDTQRMESYGNSDRGFVLRFLNAGTDSRSTERNANRGRISARGYFSSSAPRQLEAAANELADNLEKLIKMKINE